MDYTDTGKVVEALAFQSPETLNTAANAGDTSITIAQSLPPDWQVGATLVIDPHNPTLREAVMITNPPSGSTIPVEALTNSHVAGAPVVNATIVNEYVGPASRWFESMTFTPAGFGYEPYTDTKEAYVTNHGTIRVPLSKPKVAVADVTSVTFQTSVFDDVRTLDLTKAWIQDDYFLEIGLSYPPYTRQGQAVVQYSGGYQTLPDDLTNAVTILAARLYKIRDSGYSDVIGNSDLGILEYKKQIPSDVATIIRRYRRWTV